MHKILNSIAELAKVADTIDVEVVSKPCHICHRLPSGGYLLRFRIAPNFHYKIKFNAKKSSEPKPNLKDSSVLIYINKNSLYFITNNKKALTCIESLSESDNNFKVLYEFFRDLIENDLFTLEDYEKHILKLEDSLLSNNKIEKQILSEITLLKHRLISIKRYYEQLTLITDDLSEDLQSLFDKKTREGFSALDKRIDRLLYLVNHLCEELTQLREAYQSQIDIEQNNVMKFFTVITAIFLPLSLIVGWYGMNFKMPEYTWTFGYGFVFILSILVCLICYLVFKLKKWF